MPHMRTLDASYEDFDASDGYRTRYPPFPEELPTNWFNTIHFSHLLSNNTRFGASPFQCKVSATPQTQPISRRPKRGPCVQRNLPSQYRKYKTNLTS
jgi:hypothetical protein